MSTSQSNAIAPSIISVKAVNGVEIPHGAVTNETSVTITGTAEKAQRVQVFDRSEAKGEVVVDATGKWNFPLTGLEPRPHAITAKALYGLGDVSSARLFTVVSNN